MSSAFLGEALAHLVKPLRIGKLFVIPRIASKRLWQPRGDNSYHPDRSATLFSGISSSAATSTPSDMLCLIRRGSQGTIVEVILSLFCM
jgi:hypothetical protein